MTGVDWSDDDASVLVRLSTLTGFDAQGKLSEKFVLTGKAHIAAATQLEIDAMSAAFPELELTVDAVVPSYTVTFCNHDGTVVNTQLVREGGWAVDPVAAGYIDAPTKESDVEQHYTRAGWDLSLGPITADTVITAVYTASDRFYRVTYWSDEAETYKKQEKSIIAHGSSEYVGADPEKEGTIWIGWDAEASDVVSDLDIHPVFITPVLPEHMPETFDYLYSDDPDDDSALTLAEFYGIVTGGAARTYFQIGDRIRMLVDSDVFTDKDIVLKVCGFDHFRLADGSGFAGVVFGMEGLMNAGIRWLSASTNAGGWEASGLRKYLREAVYPELGPQWRAVIRNVQVRATEGGTSGEILVSEDALFAFSAAEVGYYADALPYSQEVDPEAAQVTLEAFTDNASRAKKTFNGGGTAQAWWLRSPDAGATTNICTVTTNGSCTLHYGGYGYYICFGFCM